MSRKRVPRHISAVDIGSNTVKITHARVDADGRIDELADVAETIRLGMGIEETGRIAPERIDACIGVLREQEALGRQFGSTDFIGVATETFRIAENSAALLDRVRNESAWRIRVITGDEEAHLTWLGLRGQVPADGPVMIVDIGGGSTEIIHIVNDHVAWSGSIPLGSGRLADRFFRGDPPGRESLEQATAWAAERLRATTGIPGTCTTIVFSGGNGTFIELMVNHLFPDRPLAVDTIGDLLRHFATVPASDTAFRLDIVYERARVLPAGAAIARAVLDSVRAARVAAAPSGIRTGLIRETIGEPES